MASHRDLFSPEAPAFARFPRDMVIPDHLRGRSEGAVFRKKVCSPKGMAADGQRLLIQKGQPFGKGQGAYVVQHPSDQDIAFCLFGEIHLFGQPVSKAGDLLMVPGKLGGDKVHRA
ncbi:hypothetical protein SDC9_155755 [bioreactor metagenome]|uniref:Uncharacterized protein n=1 Tax=bioreactor metagenome TaxID=1076179 RepID=A0A645F7L3_9ZZZZ